MCQSASVKNFHQKSRSVSQFHLVEISSDTGVQSKLSDKKNHHSLKKHLLEINPAE